MSSQPSPQEAAEHAAGECGRGCPVCALEDAADHDGGAWR